ncbi:MAG: DNA recombination protein RmuC [Nitrospirae bacterium]|nr:DNA recombination protein RmuC [Nitrospirota bacterium]
MIEPGLIVLTLLAGAALILLVVLLNRKPENRFVQFETQLTSFEKSQERMERSLKEEIAKNREETAVNSRQLREEIVNSMTNIANLQKDQLDIFSRQLAFLTASIEDKLGKTAGTFEEKLRLMQEQIASSARDGRDELSKALKSFEDRFSASVREFNDLQKQKFDNLTNRQTELVQSTEVKLDKMRETIEARLKLIQDDSSEKLEKMRATVDEKLHKTLEERLSQSFRIVSERLELVHKGLGEMQNLAVGVGDLKKVLSNVKTRGIIGEIMLGNILEQIMTPEQYDKNVATKKGSRDNVEFAIRLPGKDASGEIVYLPLDSKFPRENYEALVNAYEHGDPAAVEEAGKLLEGNIRKFAKDIKDKYIDPPHTTDFGIMFLPIEGLYAEVVRRPALLEVLQRDHKIMIAGPTTLSAFLSSLQMGFRTLAIEKRSSEVWNILGAVKTEFERFGLVLKKAQEKIKEADDEIDKLVGVRTRQIQRKLKDIQELPVQESLLYLSDGNAENEEVETEGGSK